MKLHLFYVAIIFCQLLTGQNKNSTNTVFYGVPEDMKNPEGLSTLRVTWNATGIDADKNIYVVWGDEKGSKRKATNTTGNVYSDCVLFKFDTNRNTFESTESLVEVLKAENNWIKDEYVEKGHTHLPYLNGKIYIGTMEFHSMEGSRNSVIERMKKYRGSHLLAYDIETKEIKDVTKSMPGGVLFPQQGMIDCGALPEYNYIVCISTPKGDIALYNTVTEKVDTIIPGPDKELGNIIFRKIISTPNGKLYYGFSDFKGTGSRMYALDINTFKTELVKTFENGFELRGFDYNKKRTKFYAIGHRCEIVTIDDLTNKIEIIGNMVPEDALVKLAEINEKPIGTGLVLSLDEKKIFSIPMKNKIFPNNSTLGVLKANGKRYGGYQSCGVYEFDLQTRKSQLIHRFSKKDDIMLDNEGCFMGRISGSALIDNSGRLFVATTGNIGLISVDVSTRIDSKFLKK